MDFFKARTPGVEHNIEIHGSRFRHTDSIGNISLFHNVHRIFI